MKVLSVSDPKPRRTRWKRVRIESERDGASERSEIKQARRENERASAKRRKERQEEIFRDRFHKKRYRVWDGSLTKFALLAGFKQDYEVDALNCVTLMHQKRGVKYVRPVFVVFGFLRGEPFYHEYHLRMLTPARVQFRKMRMKLKAQRARAQASENGAK